MALVVSIERDDREIRALHPTKLSVKFIASEQGGTKVVQLNSYGSGDREIPGKLSQTLKFTEHSARQLSDLLREEFGFGSE